MITEEDKFMIYSNNKDEVYNNAKIQKLNIEDTYDFSKKEYINSNKDRVKGVIISSSIIIAISLIEIFLMTRSSFLSRIKEVGILRAIGVKKKDIYIMFAGEIIAITTLTAVPGVLFMSYIIKLLTETPLKSMLTINPLIIIFDIILIFIFNLLVGLIPVFNTIRKRPSEILSRTDI